MLLHKDKAFQIARRGGTRWRKLPRPKIPSSPSTQHDEQFHIASAFSLYILSLMRFPSFPTLIRTFHVFTNSTFRAANPTRGIYNSPQRATLIRSMPNIPFLGALFGTKMADNTNYPIQKAEGEWQAQLSPGTSRCIRHHCLRPVA